MSRKLTSGRYETREELVMEVWEMWLNTDMHQAAIARSARVSEATVANILKGKRPDNVNKRT